MNEHLVIMPLLIPLIAAFALIPLRERIGVQRTVAGTVMVAILAVVIVLTVRLRQEGILVYLLGAWPAPYGIVLAVDLFPMLLMLMTAITGTASMFFAFRTVSPEKERFYFYPLMLFIMASVNGAFMTGDIFNLYVLLELILIASYLLFTLGGRPAQLSESFKFLVINSVSSAFVLLGIALLYSLTGTLNLADLAVQVAALADKRIVVAVASVLMFAFGVKSAMVPLFFWLPRTYAEAYTPVTALLAGVGTKVGVYALYRVFTLLFVHNVDLTHKTVLMVLAALTMVIGVLGAIAQLDFKRLLAFHIVSQIGYMIFGLAVMTVAGIAGGMMHIIFNMAIKPGLFLIAGATEEATGTSDLRKMSGVIHYAPALAFIFLLGGLSLAGVPPMSGFISKVTLFQAGFAAGHYWTTGVAVGVSFLTLFSMIKIFRMVYWGPKDGLTPEQQRTMPRWRALIAPGAALVAVGLIFGLGGAHLVDYAHAASTWLLNPAWYVEGVLGPGSAAALSAIEVMVP